MVLELHDSIRLLVEAFAVSTVRLPVYIGVGRVFLVPSESTLGSFHVVAEVTYTGEGLTYRGWVCSCKGFLYSKKGDRCRHKDLVEEGLVGAGGATKPWKSGQSSTSTTASKSKRKTPIKRKPRSTKSSAAVTKKASRGNSSKTSAQRSKQSKQLKKKTR